MDELESPTDPFVPKAMPSHATLARGRTLPHRGDTEVEGGGDILWVSTLPHFIAVLTVPLSVPWEAESDYSENIYITVIGRIRGFCSQRAGH